MVYRAHSLTAALAPILAMGARSPYFLLRTPHCVTFHCRLSSLNSRLTPSRNPNVSWFEPELKYQLMGNDDGYYPRTGARKEERIFWSLSTVEDTRQT